LLNKSGVIYKVKWLYYTKKNNFIREDTKTLKTKLMYVQLARRFIWN
jgi:GH18 family chitinase